MSLSSSKIIGILNRVLCTLLEETMVVLLVVLFGLVYMQPARPAAMYDHSRKSPIADDSGC